MRLPAILVIICYFLLLLTDWLIISDFKNLSLYNKYAPQHKFPGKWWKVYSVFAVLVLALFTVAVCMPKRALGMGVTPTMWMLYTVMSVLFSQIAYSVFSVLGFIPKLFGERRWNTALWIGLPMGVLIFSMMWWGTLIGRYTIDKEYVEISSPRVPESFDGYKIAQISDLHVGTWGQDTTFLSRLVHEVNAQNPDLIVFTGDIVNRNSDELVPFIKTLSGLRAPDGVLSVLGNHDYGDYITWSDPKMKSSNLDSLKGYQKKMGWKLLDNANVSIKNSRGDSIIVIGVGNWGEPPFSTYGNLRKAYPESALNDDNFKLLLSHNPEHWNREVSRISNIDVTLAGHTHAMQIMFKVGDWKWSPSEYRYEQWAGLYSRQNDNQDTTRVYVNIGAGEVGVPMRIGADPEITIFTLKRGV